MSRKYLLAAAGALAAMLTPAVASANPGDHRHGGYERHHDGRGHGYGYGHDRFERRRFAEARRHHWQRERWEHRRWREHHRGYYR